MLRRFKIGRHERGFLYHGQEYQRYLKPGVHWVWGFDRSLVRVSTKDAVELTTEDLEVHLRDTRCWDDLVVADLSDEERALVWVDGRIHSVLGPGRAAFWKDLHEVKLEVFSTGKLRFAHPLLDAILEADHAGLLVEHSVPKGSHGLLYVDERLEQELSAGRYAFWRGAARVRVEVVDLRETALEVAGQEILTSDKVSLRINLSASYRVEDARAVSERTANLSGTLYRELQLALREAVGTRSLDDLLADKDAVGQEIRTGLEPRAKELGVALGALGIRDIILPGEMKTLLNQVIEAEKRAKANLIQRREETAATRSLLNTARLIESSPTLLRLKELESAERIAGSIDSIKVVGGGLNGLLSELLPDRSA